jgi:hypothetical protein
VCIARTTATSFTYKLEAAADAGLDVGAPEGGHLSQLTGDLDGVMEEKTQPPLVTEPCCTGYLAEQDWWVEGGR